jgi:hypothetical protein
LTHENEDERMSNSLSVSRLEIESEESVDVDAGKITKPKHISKEEIQKRNAARKKLAVILLDPMSRNMLLASKRASKLLKKARIVPPKTFLYEVCSEFYKSTPIAIELPLMNAIALMSQYLAEKGASLILSETQNLTTELYTVILAKSGELKTFSAKCILKALRKAGWKPRMLPVPGSSAAFLKMLAKNDGKPVLLDIDEWGQWWTTISEENQSSTKRYLLMSYDQVSIDKALCNETISVEQPRLSMIGSTVIDFIDEQISPNDWKSGLCQRIGFVIAHRDPDRPWDNPRYAILKPNLNRVTTAFKEAMKTPVRNDYFFTDQAVTRIRSWWAFIGKQGLDHDFVRRLEFRAFKYSIIFHWLLGKSNREIDVEDIDYAMRLTLLHIADLKELLNLSVYREFKFLVRRTKEVMANLKAQNEPVTPRRVFMNLKRHVSSVKEVEAIMEIISNENEQKGGDEK